MGVVAQLDSAVPRVHGHIHARCSQPSGRQRKRQDGGSGGRDRAAAVEEPTGPRGVEDSGATGSGSAESDRAAAVEEATALCHAFRVTFMRGVAVQWRRAELEEGSSGRHPWPREVVNNVTLWDGPLLLANTIVAGILPHQPPRWWMKRRTGGTSEDLCVRDDATEEYFHDKLRMSTSVFYGIVAALLPYLQRQITPFRQPLQPDRIVAYALYRWASGETYDSGTSNFGIGRASGIAAVEDVTRALHRAYPDKIKMPTGRRRKQVMDAFERKGFPRCMGAIDCTHLYVDKPANAPAENFCDRHRQFSVVAQVVVDMDMRILDVFVGYPGSVHDSRVLRNSSLYRRAQVGVIFDADPLVLPGGVSTRGYVLADNGYGALAWLVIPYPGQHVPPDETRFNDKYKAARSVVERAFGRLKGMWRLYLRTHKTNVDTLPQQFMAVCILHNIFIDAGVEFDEQLLMDVDDDGNPVPIDIGLISRIPPMNMGSPAALAVRTALKERMALE
ncbi:hypothetical protein CBR_g49639 [Chara braunii]|uniref:DDE Tnp4 domain-containing protein n=1 Tax=Chara braunii TaxID=69332 RepID=A0A388M5C5_CHABU|nr:hypothetical protein CBR_g49639 [Chara braunii]|eukprot:GBG89788.1 hypothetical protein CBR_g49639 [Chara braunii]